jgi:anti-sigma-K factor RskA
MKTATNNAQEREEIETLLPWYAAGTLSRRDTARVEDALARDAELARRFELVREELGETIRVNESLGAPSARAMKALFEKIDAEPARQPAASFNLMGRISQFMASFQPRTLAYAGGVAVLALVLQAGVITNLVSERTGTRAPDLASAPVTMQAPQGVQALVRFTPTASAAEITAFLAANNATVIGSTADGNFRLLVPGKDASEIVKKLSENKVVSSALPVAR